MKREILKETIELEEPMDIDVIEIDDIVPQDDIVIEDEIPQEIKDNAVTSLLMDEIANLYASIDSLGSLIATFSSDNPREDIISIINQIIDDRTIQVGMLQKAIDLINGKSVELVDAGIEAAELISQQGTLTSDDEE